MRLVVLASLLTAAPAMAQTAGTPAPAASATTAAAATTATDKKICRREATTGSIMPARRVCRSKADWDRIGVAAAANADRYQNERTHGSMGDPSSR